MQFLTRFWQPICQQEKCESRNRVLCTLLQRGGKRWRWISCSAPVPRVPTGHCFAQTYAYWSPSRRRLTVSHWLCMSQCFQADAALNWAYSLTQRGWYAKYQGVGSSDFIRDILLTPYNSSLCDSLKKFTQVKFSVSTFTSICFSCLKLLSSALTIIGICSVLLRVHV